MPFNAFKSNWIPKDYVAGASIEKWVVWAVDRNLTGRRVFNEQDLECVLLFLGDYIIMFVLVRSLANSLPNVVVVDFRLVSHL